MIEMNERLLRRTKIPGWFEMTKTSCPVCGHSGGCIIHADGNAVACIRIDSKKPFSKNSATPSWLHILKGEKRAKMDVSDLPTFEQSQKLSDHKLDLIYRKFLELLTLTDEHYEHLTNSERQLTDRQVSERGYKSFPKNPQAVAKSIMDALGIQSLEGVPGFYLKGNNWTIKGRDGILIPFRNEMNMIVGFQYRIDKPMNDVTVQCRKTFKAKVIKQPNLVQVTYEGKVILEQEFELKKPVLIHTDKEHLGTVTLKKGNRYFWCAKRFSISV